MELITSQEELERRQTAILQSRDPAKPSLSVCGGPGCLAFGCKRVVEALKGEISAQGLDEAVDLRVTGCHGFCEIGPLVVLFPNKVLYQGVRPDDVQEIVASLSNGQVVERLLYEDPLTENPIEREDEVPFYKFQFRPVFGLNNLIDPHRMEDYIALGGYGAAAKVLNDMSPEEVIEQVKQSGLRGRGGGGFPAGRKWESCRKAEGNIKYVLCNADEGDPGAFMDRCLLEGNPHSVLEGMIIGAYAIGSNEGYLYVRSEYPIAVRNAGIAIEQAREAGLLGNNILGTGFDFDIKINRGGGAFVCGESTALMASIEGKPGEPRAKYVHTVERGLWDRPSCLNNVETWANVPLIINKGASWYAGIGSDGSKGTKIFSLVGKVMNSGIIEVPLGTTLREIIYGIGGGIIDGKAFKGVQTGGPSGGIIPQEYLDRPVDFDELTKLGSMMGSGGMIVMDEDTCMVDVAKYFLKFLSDESCGKCTPCREGVKVLHGVVDSITRGEGKEGDMEFLEEVSAMVVDSSLCALGGSAPNPLLTAMRYYEEEFRAHISDKQCPSKVCRGLITYEIVPEDCTGCQVCIDACPEDAITGELEEVHVINQELCDCCGGCYEVCPYDAIVIY
jgi:NADH:ubiquinone oxidoreductase subunit F (NADH-binding)/(2Fe-2S) ferredoxin/Pyruvate/2-oxoacid:ferredoxin oxidoreductase delta subunit